MKTHVGHLLAKLGFTDRVQLVVFAYEHELVRPGAHETRPRSTAAGTAGGLDGRPSPRADEQPGGRTPLPPTYGGNASGEREGGGHEPVGRHRAAASAALPGPAARRSLLGVGAVLLVSAGATFAVGPRRPPRPVLLVLVLAGAAAGSPCGRRAGAAQLRGDARRLRGRAGRRGGLPAGRPSDGDPGTALLLAVGLPGAPPASPDDRDLAPGVLGRRAARRPAGLDSCPAPLHTELYLCVALVGLGIALFGRRVVGRRRC